MPEKELTYESAFPGRFLTAGHFDGKKITLTVADVYQEDLEGSDKKSKPPKMVMSFVGKKMELVIPKTNAYCIKEMFGRKCIDWVGKRITFFPTKCRFGPSMVDCIRVWGSPDFPEDRDVTVPQGRNTPWQTTLHTVKLKPEPAPAAATANGHASNGAEKKTNGTDPRIVAAWEILNWTKEECTESRANFEGTGGEYISHLSGLIDQMNAAEAS
jgi:hypothetical protein